jgi:cysteine dioxygenase
MLETFTRKDLLETCSDDRRVSAWLNSLAAAARAVPRPALPNGKLYSRTLMFGNDEFELLALHWRPGAMTSIHDHGGQRCWFMVVDGSIDVENFRRFDAGTTPGRARIESAGRFLVAERELDARTDALDLHRCVAAAESEVLSLHLYVKPIARFNIFDDRKSTCQMVTPSYDARCDLAL